MKSKTSTDLRIRRKVGVTFLNPLVVRWGSDPKVVAGEENDVHANAVVEQEARLEELVIKLAFVENSLAELRDLPFDDDLESESSEKSLLEGMEAKGLRSLLWAYLDDHSEMSLELKRAREDLDRRSMTMAAAEEKQELLEQQNAELRRGYRERLSMLQSEKIEFAQSVLSPNGKKQSQLSTLQSLNSSLEVLLLLAHTASFRHTHLTMCAGRVCDPKDRARGAPRQE